MSSLAISKILTLLIYLGLSLLIAVLFKLSIKAKNQDKQIHFFNKKINNKIIYYFIIYFVFIIFACFRTIAPGIGGADTQTYINYFNMFQYTPFFSLNNLLLNSYEYLFYNLMFLIRTLGGNFFVFSFIIYSIIIIALIYVVDKNIKNEKQWMWLILLFLPLLKSLNIVRNIVSASIGFVALEFLKDNNSKNFWILAIAAFLNHYIAIILIIFYFFCKYFPEKILLDNKKVLFLNGLIIIASITFLPLAKLILSISGFSGYLNKIEISLWGYIPIVFFYILMLYDSKFKNYLKDIKHFIYYKMMIFLSFILPIFILLNGASRILLFFEIPRYILYSDMYMFFKSKISSNYLKVYEILTTIFIVLWLIFRIVRMWEGYDLVPYYNNLF
ncbi:MAG: EpsG family protein [Firmicutes bacterium]|nr:EpsG family protein [Bacillota bacterium]